MANDTRFLITVAQDLTPTQRHMLFNLLTITLADWANIKGMDYDSVEIRRVDGE